MNHIHSIRFTLIVVLMVSVVLPATIISGIAINNSLTSSLERSQERLEAISTLKKAQIMLYINDLSTTLSLAFHDASNQAMVRVLTENSSTSLKAQYKNRLQLYLAAFLEQTRKFQALTLLNAEGEVLISTHQHILFYSPLNLQDLNTQRTTGWLQSFAYTKGAPLRLAFFQPIMIDNQVVAILVGHVSTRELNAILAGTTGLGQTGASYLLDSQGTLLTPLRITQQRHRIGDRTLMPTNIPYHTIDSAPVMLPQGENNPRNVMAVYQRLPMLEAVLVVEQQRGEILASTYDTLINSALLGTLSLILVVVLGLLIMERQIVIPVKGLAHAAREIAQGQLDRRAVVTSRNEIGQLAKTFNNMAAELSQTIHAMETLNRELESRVGRRTRDLEIARAQAEKANQIKSLFLANMSHELRTPLNAILNFSQFVSSGLMGPVTENQVDALDKVVSSGKHLLTLINDILDISRIESGELKLFIEKDVNLKKECHDVIEIAQTLLNNRSVTLKLEAPDDLPTLFCDSRRIRQVLLNLLSNACKFTEQGEIILRLSHTAEHIICAVQDTGPGIAPEDHQAIFETFRQSESGWRHGEGTGLGLPISRRLVEAHGGELWVESTLGKGAAFFAKLPIKSPELVRLSQESTFKHPLATLQPPSFGKTS